ncbi:unnamed protein product [Linum trigynum]|uniref:Uncharacterized protein n=1 Tax=Linum trigynum TaxID=586398 RepID=A0AAV2F7S5_9ROSI
MWFMECGVEKSKHDTNERRKPQHVVERAKEIFYEDTRKLFALQHCWEILQHSPEFLQLFLSPVPSIPPMGGSSLSMPSSENDSPDIQNASAR